MISELPNTSFEPEKYRYTEFRLRGDIMQNHYLRLQTVYSEKPLVSDIREHDLERLSPRRLGSENLSFYHYHNSFEVGYCFEGSGSHCTPDGVFPFQAGDTLFILPGHPHYTISDHATTSLWLFLYFDLEKMLRDMFRRDNLSSASALNPALSLYDLIARKQYPRISEMIQAILQQYQTFLPGRNELLCSLFLELLFTLSRENGPLPPCRVCPAMDYGKLNGAIQFINDSIDAGQIPSVEDAAASLYMSVSNFRKIFREIIGFPPHDFIMQAAIRRTQKLLLSSNMRIIDICAEVGFHSVASLNRNFMLQCGMSPQTYRKIHKSLY